MRNFWIIYKKEMRTYFVSPIAYAILTFFLLISGFFYWNIIKAYSDYSYKVVQYPEAYLSISEYIVRPFFNNISVIMLFLLPILTMRLIAEERHSGTLKLLLSYPIKDIELLTAKFFSAISMLIIMFLLTFPFPLFLYSLGSPETGPFITNYLGIILMGTAFISLGLFASTITDKQVVAAVISFGALISFWVINWARESVGIKLKALLDEISILHHMENFSRGVISTHDIAYYILFTGFFFFLAMIALESRTWRSRR